MRQKITIDTTLKILVNRKGDNVPQATTSEEENINIEVIIKT